MCFRQDIKVILLVIQFAEPVHDSAKRNISAPQRHVKIFSRLKFKLPGEGVKIHIAHPEAVQFAIKNGFALGKVLFAILIFKPLPDFAAGALRSNQAQVGV